MRVCVHKIGDVVVIATVTTIVAMNRLECPGYGEYRGKSLTDLIRHVRLYHADSRMFSVHCRGCGRDKPFKSFYTWCDHMYSYHSESEPQEQLDSMPAASSSSSTFTNLADIFEEDRSHTDIDENDLLDPSQDQTRDNMGSSILQRAAATFTLKIHETHQLPQSTMDTILKELDNLHQVS